MWQLKQAKIKAIPLAIIPPLVARALDLVADLVVCHGTGEGTGVGDGRGHGTGTGDGTGEGDGHGTGKAAFNVEGFYAAVDSQNKFLMRLLSVKMNVDVTINVMAKIRYKW